MGGRADCASVHISRVGRGAISPRTRSSVDWPHLSGNGSAEVEEVVEVMILVAVVEVVAPRLVHHKDVVRGDARGDEERAAGEGRDGALA